MCPQTVHVTGREVERVILRDGWYLHHSRGSHFYYRRSDHLGKQVTLPIHAGEVLPQKTFRSILEQAGLTLEEFVNRV
ncbi:type II toxin-antitoxin system HicA family toxin [Chloroflexota bacterium]